MTSLIQSSKLSTRSGWRNKGWVCMANEYHGMSIPNVACNVHTGYRVMYSPSMARDSKLFRGRGIVDERRFSCHNVSTQASKCSS